jgi:hypothetical protein
VWPERLGITAHSGAGGDGKIEVEGEEKEGGEQVHVWEYRTAWGVQWLWLAWGAAGWQYDCMAIWQYGIWQ